MNSALTVSIPSTDSLAFSGWFRLRSLPSSNTGQANYLRDIASSQLSLGRVAGSGNNNLAVYDGVGNVCTIGSMSMDVSTEQNPFWVFYTVVDNHSSGSSNKTVFRNGVYMPFTSVTGTCTAGTVSAITSIQVASGNMAMTVADLRYYYGTPKTVAQVQSAYANGGWSDTAYFQYSFGLLTSYSLVASTTIVSINYGTTGDTVGNSFVQTNNLVGWRGDCVCNGTYSCQLGEECIEYRVVSAQPNQFNCTFLDLCASSPCQNGASCTNNRTIGYTCTCAPGYSGSRCQTDVDECASYPCSAGSRCVDHVNSYTCVSDHCGFALNMLDSTDAVSPTTPIHRANAKTVSFPAAYSVTFSGWFRVNSLPKSNDGPANYFSDTIGGMHVSFGRIAGSGNNDLSVYDPYGNICTIGSLSMDVSTSSDRFWVFYVVVDDRSSGASNKTVFRNGRLMSFVSKTGTCVAGTTASMTNLMPEFGTMDMTLSDLRIYFGSPKNATAISAAYRLGRWTDLAFFQYSFAIAGYGTSYELGTGGYITNDENPAQQDGILDGYLQQPFTVAVPRYGVWRGDCICQNVVCDQQCSASNVNPCGLGEQCSEWSINAGFANAYNCSFVDLCVSSPCQNGGVCSNDRTLGFSCACPVGYSGRLCQTDINECASGPCRNGATCTDLVNGYSCTCATAFTGTNCELSGYRLSPSDLSLSDTSTLTCNTGAASSTRTCGIFTESSYKICPDATASVPSACTDYCSCRNGTGQTPVAGSLQCDGLDLPCDTIESRSSCGGYGFLCTKRCRYTSSLPITTQCGIVAGTCRSTVEWVNCTATQIVNGCGEAAVSCLARYENGTFTGSVSQCACSSTGVRMGSTACVEWISYNFSDANPLSSSCSTECGRGVLMTGRTKPGDRFLRTVPGEYSGKRGHYNCAIRRMIMPNSLAGSLTLTRNGSIPYGTTLLNGGLNDRYWQYLVRTGVVAWNNTGWTESMAVVRTMDFTDARFIYLRHCDCSGVLPNAVDVTMTDNSVYSTYANITTVAYANTRLLVNACTGLYSNYLSSTGKLESVAHTTATATSRYNSQSNAFCSGRGVKSDPTETLITPTTLAAYEPYQSGDILVSVSGRSYTSRAARQTVCGAGTIHLQNGTYRAKGTAGLSISTQTGLFMVSTWVKFVLGAPTSGTIFNVTRGSPAPALLGLVITSNSFQLTSFSLTLTELKMSGVTTGDSFGNSPDYVSTSLSVPASVRDGSWHSVVARGHLLFPYRIELCVDDVDCLTQDRGDFTFGALPSSFSVLELGSSAVRLAYIRLLTTNVPTASNMGVYYAGTTGWPAADVFYELTSFVQSTTLNVSINSGLASSWTLQRSSGINAYATERCISGGLSCSCHPGWDGASCDTQTVCQQDLTSVASQCGGDQSDPANGFYLFGGASRARFWASVKNNYTCQRLEHCDERGLDLIGRTVICNHNETLVNLAAFDVGFVCDCPPGTDRNGAQCTAPSTATPCSSHGNRTGFDPVTNLEQCLCDRAWTGSACSVRIECPGVTGLGSSCAGLAMHVDTETYNSTHCTRVCIKTGTGNWTGPCCSDWNPIPQAVCPATIVTSSASVQITSTTGAVLTNPDILQCTCGVNSTGSDCSFSSCPIVNGRVCSGQGSCSAGSCSCVAGRTGCACQYNLYALCATAGTTCGNTTAADSITCSPCNGVDGGSCISKYTQQSPTFGCQCKVERGGNTCNLNRCPGNCNKGLGYGNCLPDFPGNETTPVCSCTVLGCGTSQLERIRAGADCSIDACNGCANSGNNAYVTDSTKRSQYSACDLAGRCVATNGVPACVCDEGRTGAYCQFSTTCTSCSLVGNDYCDGPNNVCPCLPGYIRSGSQCVSRCNAFSSVVIPNLNDLGNINNYYCACSNSSFGNSTCKASDLFQLDLSKCCTSLACPISPVSNTPCGAVTTAKAIAYCGTAGQCVCEDRFAATPVYAYESVAGGYCRPICNPDQVTNPKPCVFTHVTRRVNGQTQDGVQCTGCVCKTGYTSASNCYSSICQNGGTLVAGTTTCLCATGWQGSTCQTSVCNGVGSLVSGSCSCLFPYVAAGCVNSQCSSCVNGCLNGGTVSVSMTCTCPLAWNGTLCQTSLCGSFGLPSSNGLQCTCDSFHSGTYCTQSTCQHGGTYSSGACLCTNDFTGTYCERPLCGAAGFYNATIGGCQCIGAAYGRDTVTGNCTRSLCGTFGTPLGALVCQCLSGARINNVTTTHPFPCEPICLNGGVLNATVPKCDCPDAFPVLPYCRPTPLSSTAVAVVVVPASTAIDDSASPSSTAIDDTELFNGSKHSSLPSFFIHGLLLCFVAFLF